LIVQTGDDLLGMQAACEAVALTLKSMIHYAKPGMNTLELDEYGAELLKNYGAISAPIKDYTFPGYTCISLNKEVAHGIPSTSKILKDGDLINIDVSAELNGYYGDNGFSFILGKDIHNLQPLVSASREILLAAVKEIRAGVRISAVGRFIQQKAAARGFKVIKNLVGHGIGRKLHEDPEEVPCFYDPYNKAVFKNNSVIALETFISTKASFVKEDKDGWTMITRDGSYVAQHEHTLIVTNDVPTVLTWQNGI
jgi:methionyl aminopeptidase